MTFREPFPILYAGDCRASGGVLLRGVRVRGELPLWPSEGELEYAFLRLGQTGIGIGHASIAPGISAPGREAPPRFELCLYTDYTDAAATRLRALGPRELLAPSDQPWGERVCAFADPDGNPLHVTMKLGS